jgi:hypothetical protein
MTNNDNDNLSNNDDTSDNDDNNRDKESQTMAMTATTTKTAPAAATKKAEAKTMGEDIINIDSPPRKKQHAANRAASYFSTMILKGYMVNPYSKGSKNMINVVFHKGGMPPESKKLLMLLNLGGRLFKLSGRHLKSFTQMSKQPPKASKWTLHATRGTR